EPRRDPLLFDHPLPRLPGRIHDVDGVARLRVLLEPRIEALRREAPELTIETEVGAAGGPAEERGVSREPERVRVPRHGERREERDRAHERERPAPLRLAPRRLLLQERLDARRDEIEAAAGKDRERGVRRDPVLRAAEDRRAREEEHGERHSEREEEED